MGPSGEVRYKDFFGRNDAPFREAAENLPAIPITTKEDIRKASYSFIPNGLPKSALDEINTSGSTGIPIKTFVDKAGLEYRMALEYMVNMEFGLSLFDLTGVVTPHPTPQHPLLAAMGLFRKIKLPASDDEGLNFSILRSSNIQILSSYPSLAYSFALINEREGGTLKLKHAICFGEVLRKGWRNLISESFSCPVFDFYGTVEMHCVAWECPEEHNLHVNSNSCIMEIVDAEGRPKKRGTGRVVLTTLHNRAMPLLRYDIGDLASWGKECACGRGLPVIKSLEGRSDDILVLPSGKMRPGTLLADINDRIEDTAADPYFRAFQYVQERDDLIVFRFVPAKDALPMSIMEDIARSVSLVCLGESVNVEFEEVQSIPRGPSGKLRSVISKVKPLA